MCVQFGKSQINVKSFHPNVHGHLKSVAGYANRRLTMFLGPLKYTTNHCQLLCFTVPIICIIYNIIQLQGTWFLRQIARKNEKAQQATYNIYYEFQLFCRKDPIYVLI